uniref:Uncharacterized protein n=1 Tax=Oryza punctata TaxID=4537 RepID=A0A0E0M5T1_ORYPU
MVFLCLAEAIVSLFSLFILSPSWSGLISAPLQQMARRSTRKIRGSNRLGSGQQPTRTYNSNLGESKSTTHSVSSGKKAGVECYTCHKMDTIHGNATITLSNATTGGSVQGNARPQNSRSVSFTSPAATQGRLNHVQAEANKEVLEVDTVGEAYEDQVPQEEADPQYDEAW